jgi:hypothetical protein
MATARSLISTTLVLVGAALGAAAAAGCAYLGWPTSEYSALHDLFADIRITLLVWVVVAMPFVWIANLIDRSPKRKK